MKKILLAATAVMFGASSFAQVANSFLNEARVLTKEICTDTEVLNKVVANSNSRVSAYNDTVWFDGFENSSVWTINNQTTSSGWEISATTVTWAFSSGINSTTGGNYAVMVPDDPNSPVSTANYITTANAIDISGFSNQNLVLSYEKYGARYYDTLKVEVSNDNSTWTTLDYNTDFPILTANGGSATANPASRDLFIPSSIVNNDSLYIRFYWDADRPNVSGIGYGWFIDDVMLLNTPNNDLVLEKASFFEGALDLYSWYYGVIPERQAAADSITFSGLFYNRGSVDQPNARLEVTVSGQDNQSFVSNVIASAPAGALSDTLETSTTYAPSAGQGTYTFTWNILSDSSDATPTNNMRSVDMEVHDHIFSLTPLQVSEANVVGKTGSTSEAYVASQNYFFNVADTVIGFGVAFDSEWTVEGAGFQLSLTDGNDNVVAASGILSVTAEMIADEVMWFPVPETPIAAGNYTVNFEAYEIDNVFLVSCMDPTLEAQYDPISNSYNARAFTTTSQGSFIEDMFFMNIVTKPGTPVNCNSNASVSGIVDDQAATGSISITGVNGLQNNSINSYSWSGPNNYLSSSMGLTGLQTQGDYTVTVTDIYGCTAEATFTVAGTVSTDDVPSLEESLSVFPNPSNGDFSLRFNNLDDVYTVNVYSTIGQLVDTRKVNVNGGSQIEEFNSVNLTKGIYFVNVKGSDNNETTLRVVVK